jgi:hypothetical protein
VRGPERRLPGLAIGWQALPWRRSSIGAGEALKETLRTRPLADPTAKMARIKETLACPAF